MQAMTRSDKKRGVWEEEEWEEEGDEDDEDGEAEGGHVPALPERGGAITSPWGGVGLEVVAAGGWAAGPVLCVASRHEPPSPPSLPSHAPPPCPCPCPPAGPPAGPPDPLRRQLQACALLL